MKTKQIAIQKTLGFFSVILLCQMALTPTAYAQFGKEWLRCRTDADCIKVNGLCGRKDSINKKFNTDFEGFKHKMQSMSSCSALSEKEKNHNENSEAKCVVDQCKLEDIKVNPPADKK